MFRTDEEEFSDNTTLFLMGILVTIEATSEVNDNDTDTLTKVIIAIAKINNTFFNGANVQRGALGWMTKDDDGLWLGEEIVNIADVD